MTRQVAGGVKSLARACVQDLPRYLGPLVSGPPNPSVMRMGSNENPLGAGPKARAVLENAPELVGRYPEDGSGTLRRAIAEFHGVRPEQVLVGNGSNEIIELTARAFLEPGVGAVFSEYCFSVYPLIVQSTGAESSVAAAADYRASVDNLLGAVRANTRVLFVDNPSNPTAGYIPGADIRRLLEQLPPEVVVLLDQAYGEYVQQDDYEGWHQLSPLHPTLILTRSFSKMHGLPGLRVGYGIASEEVIDVLERVRPPFGVNLLAQLAAEAALADEAHVQHSLKLNNEGMQWLCQRLQQLSNQGVEILATAANFITCRSPWPADDLCAALLQRGVLVRSLAPYAMPEFLRITVGRPEENRAFIEALEAELDART